MGQLSDLRGVALLQSGSHDLVGIAGGTTGTAPDNPCSMETPFQLASVSKQFTAAAVLLLVDRGDLSLDDTISRWIEAPPSWDSITIHHLLTHTSGLVHWGDIPQLDLTTPIEPADELAIFWNAPLLSAPGERFRYSSPGYVLLAHVVQLASGQSYGSFLDDNIFGTLAMTSTFAGNSAISEVARGHRGGDKVPSFELDVVGMGAGDIWSTARDVTRWDLALAAGKLLSEDARNAMFSVHTQVSDPVISNEFAMVDGYGYGWFIGTTHKKQRIVFHPGGNAGFLAFNGWFINQDIRLVVLSNEETTDLGEIVTELATAIT